MRKESLLLAYERQIISKDALSLYIYTYVYIHRIVEITKRVRI